MHCYTSDATSDTEVFRLKSTELEASSDVDERVLVEDPDSGSGLNDNS
jgi:hypothetical protein